MIYLVHNYSINLKQEFLLIYKTRGSIFVYIHVKLNNKFETKNKFFVQKIKISSASN
jgi:hypothetical protein